MHLVASESVWLKIFYCRARTSLTQSNTIRPLGDRPDLTDDDPSTGAPRVSKVDDKQPHHSHRSPASSLVRFPLVFVFRKDNGDDDVTGRHANGSDNQNRFAAELVDVSNGGHSRYPHDYTDDTSCKQRRGIRGLAEACEDLRGII